MPTVLKCWVAPICLAVAMAAIPGSRAQSQQDLPPAPLPTQIFTAKKVFLSNGGGDVFGYYSGGPDRAYNELYAALKGWGRYELVAVPADAELVFEINLSLVNLGEAVSGGAGTPVSSKTVLDPQFRLTIRDLKTQVLLWTFTGHVQNAVFKGNRDKNFDLAMAALVNDIRNVAGKPAATTGNTSK